MYSWLGCINPHRETAIQDKVMSGYEFRFIASQVECGLGNVVDGELHSLQLGELSGELIKFTASQATLPRSQRSFQPGRRDAVHSDAKLAELSCQVPGQSHRRVLRSGVRMVGATRHHRRDACGENDAAFPLGNHHSPGVFRRQEHSGDVDAHGLVEGGQRELGQPELRCARDACVAVHDIDLAVLGERRVDGVPDVVLASHVAADVCGAVAVAGDFVRHPFADIILDIQDYNLRAVAVEKFCRAKSNPAGGSSYQSYLAFKPVGLKQSQQCVQGK